MDITSKKSYPVSGSAKRTILGGIVNFLGQGIIAIEHIILVPLFLYAWGESRYGEWLTLFSIVSYLSLSNMGASQFIVNRLTQAHANGDDDKYFKILRSALVLYSFISTGLFLLFSGLVLISPIDSWFNISLSGLFEVKITVIILAGYILLGILSDLLIGLYSSFGDYVRGRLLTNAREILLVGFVALSLFFKSGFIVVAGWYLVLLIIFMGVSFFDIRIKYGGSGVNRVKTDWGLGWEFVKQGAVFLIIPLASAIKIQGSVLITSYFLGPLQVAVFGVHRTLANLVSRLTSFFVPSIKPEIAASEARGDYEKVRLFHSLLLKIILILSVSAISVLWLVGEDIIKIWTSGKIDFNYYLWLVLLLRVMVYSIWNFSSTFQVAINKYKKYALVEMASAIIGLILAINLVDKWGIVGVAGGFLIAELILDLWLIPIFTLKIIKQNKIDFLSGFIKGGPIWLIQIVVTYALGLVINWGWWGFILGGMVSLLAGFYLGYVFWMNKLEKLIAVNILERIRLKLFSRA